MLIATVLLLKLISPPMLIKQLTLQMPVIHCNSLPPTSHTHSHSHTHSLTLAYTHTHTHHTHMHTTEHTFSIHDEPLYRPSKDDDDVPPLDISSDKPS